MSVCVQSMCRCLESIKCQVCQLTKANECAKRQRDEFCHCNETYKCRVRELEQELCHVNSVIDCLRDKVRRTVCTLDMASLYEATSSQER